MVEDLKRQASELYKEHSEKDGIPTSDSLSMKKFVYITLGLLAALALVILSLGGFKSRPNPIMASTTPVPVVAREQPPPELLQNEDQGATAQITKETTSPESPATPAAPGAPEIREKKVEEPQKAPVRENRPSLRKETEEVRISEKKISGGNARKTEADAPKPVPPPPPEPSPLEVARQELARDIALESSPALSKLTNGSDQNLVYQGWKATSDGADSMQVSFTFLDKSTGSPLQYIWRVNLTGRSITPLSYYARRLQ